MVKKYIHSFGKYFVDLVLVVFWIYIPMYFWGLKDAPEATFWWFLDIVTLVILLYFLHTRGGHKLS